MRRDKPCECDPEVLRGLILESFPSYPFHGRVMYREDNAEAVEYECEADDLDKVIGGQAWMELSTEFILSHEDDYLLMMPEAAAAFLGAWLWRAIESFDRDNPVRDALIFHVRWHGGSPGGTYGLWNVNLRLLNQRQREVILSTIQCAAAQGPRLGDRSDAAEAVARIYAYHGWAH